MKILKLFALILLSVFCLIACNKTSKSEAIINEGAKLFEQGKFDEAAAKYQQAIEAEPNNPFAYNLLGMAHRFNFNKSGDQAYKDKEIAAFKKAVEIDENFWMAHKNLAATYYYIGKKKEAIPHIEKALELQPNDPEKPLLLKWIEEAQQ